MRQNGSVALVLAKGAIAGAAAAWLMNQATTWMYKFEGDETKALENEARGGQSAFANAVDQAADAASVTLSDSRRDEAASALHYATGIAAGMLYAVMRRRAPSVAVGGGLAFGAAWFLAIDELMNTAVGLTPGPRAFPWQAHARGLGGHLAFGVANELVLEGLDRIA